MRRTNPEGTLWCSGLIAGASILGILAAIQSAVSVYITAGDSVLLPSLAILRDLPFGAVAGENSILSDYVGFGVLLFLCLLMFWGARPSRSTPAPHA